MGLRFNESSSVRVIPLEDAPPMPCIRSFRPEQVSATGFNPFEGIERFPDFAVFYQLQRWEPVPAGYGREGEATQILENVILVHSQQHGQQFFIDRLPKNAEDARADYRFRAAALLGCCWSESPWDQEALQFMMLLMMRQGPQPQSARKLGTYGTDRGICYPDPWKIHSPGVDYKSTAEWFAV